MNRIARVIALSSLVAVGAVASAQTNGPQGLSARIGWFFPRVGDNDFSAGLDYKFSNVPVEPARGEYLSYLGLTADYYGRSNAYNIPIAVTYNARVNQLVFSGGVGVDVYRRFGESKAGLGAQIGVAYEFGPETGTARNPVFLQAKYFFANNSDLNGLAVYVGVRF